VGSYCAVFTSQKAQIIRNNIITGNESGISISSGSIAIIINNEIIDNGLYSDGIHVLTGAKALIARNHIAENAFGIFSSTPGPVEIINNTIVNNDINIIIGETTTTLTNNIIAWGEYGIYFSGDYYPDINEYVSQFLTISYNDVWQNSSYNYFASLGLQIWGPFDPNPGDGEIHENPLFVDPDNGDFHLKIDSPCIDTGNPDSPNVLWGGFRRDMGAFEFDQGFYFDGQDIILKPFPIEIPTLQWR